MTHEFRPPKPYRKAMAFICPTCAAEEEGYYGRLVFPDELEDGAPPVTCPYHKKVTLVPTGSLVRPLRGNVDE